MKYFCLVLMLGVAVIVGAQCSLSKTSYPVKDLINENADTTNIPILVHGAVQNNLATAQQGLCGVKIKFKHPYMKELVIELISPGGQSIILIGGEIVAEPTPLITWDVTFVPCGSVANPDFGILPKWENNQDWEIGELYNGQYYPHLGCLEAFTTGTVNGTWTLRCIDNDDYSEGLILGAELFFCQPEGLFCSDCVIDPGSINNPDINLCESSPDLLINIDKSFTTTSQNAAVYEYTNIIFNESSIIKYENTPDLRTQQPGNYTICGLQYSKLQGDIIPLPGSLFRPDSLREYMFKKGACAGLSQNCMTVNISASIAPLARTVTICKGDAYSLGGQSFSQPGTYTVKIAGSVCDSTILLDLRVIDLNPIIMSVGDTITCTNATLTLQGVSNGNGGPNVKYFWKTSNGFIQGDSTQSLVTIQNEGIYKLYVADVDFGCIDSTTKTIYNNQSFVNTTFTTDTLSCKREDVDIHYFTSAPITEQSWRSSHGHPFTVINDGINVKNSDWYIFTVKGLNGCVSEDSVFVHENKVFVFPNITSTTITCDADTAYISNVHDVFPGEYQYTWTGVPLQYSHLKEPFYLKAGNYELTLTKINNGCEKTIDIVISQDQNMPSITISDNAINCNNINATPKVSTDHPLIKYLWTGPGFFSDRIDPQIKAPGRYRLVVTSGRNGCTATSDFEVSKDTSIANISYIADQLSCNVDSVIIKAESDKALKSFFWTGPQGFFSSLMQPKVGLVGTYSIHYIGENNCSGQKDIFIGNSLEVPNVFYNNDTLRCGEDTITMFIINPDNLSFTYDYLWSGPNAFTNTNAEPKVTIPGDYSVTITNPVSGCKIERHYSIFDDRIYSSPLVDFEALTCSKDSAKIVILNQDIKSVTIKGSDFLSYSSEVYVKNTGVYQYEIINNKNCPSLGFVTILLNDTIPVINALFDRFKCQQDSMLLSGLSTINGTQFKWSNQSGYTATGQQVYCATGGVYTVEGTAPNGCKASMDFTIGYDTIHTQFSIIKPDTITCIKNEITLKTNLVQPKGKLYWFPSGLEEQEVKVIHPGKYIASYTAENNCVTIDSITVPENRNYPGYDTEATIINCKNLLSTAKIIPKSVLNTIKWKNDTNPIMVSNGVFQFNTSFAGNYIFYLINPEGCETEGHLVITSDTSAPVILKRYEDTLTCDHLVTDIGVGLSESAIEYLWNGPGVIDVKTDGLLNVDKGGYYFLKITGRNYCVTNTQFNILRDVNLPIFSTFTDTLTCNNAKINIGIQALSEISKYVWEGPDGFTSDIAQPKVFNPGMYAVTMTGENGCTASAVIHVAQNIIKPQIDMNDTILLPCDTSRIDLKLNGNFTFEKYRWIFPDGSIYNDISPSSDMIGNYFVQVTAKNGCKSQLKSFIVKINDLPLSYDYRADTINCQKNQATLTVSSKVADLEYIWISPSNEVYTQPHITTTESGLFALIVTSKEKCADTTYIQVVKDTIIPDIHIQVIGELQCEIKTLSLNGTKPQNGNIIPKWSTSTGTFLSSPDVSSVKIGKPGLYYYELSNTVNKCQSQSQVEIKENNQEFSNFTVDVTAPTCNDIKNGILKIINFNGTPPYTIELNKLQKGNQIQFFNLESGLYNVVATDSFGCKVQKQASIPKATEFTIDIEKELLIKFGDSIVLKPDLIAGVGGRLTLKWTKGDSIICSDCNELEVRPYVNTIYNVEYSIDGLCKKYISTLVRVENDIATAIPNIFAPNSSGNNQFFYIPQTRGIERINSIKIFNRWAENVFVGYNLIPGDVASGWDGYFNGRQVQPGVFVIIAELVLSDGSIWRYNGDLTVLR